MTKISSILRIHLAFALIFILIEVYPSNPCNAPLEYIDTFLIILFYSLCLLTLFFT